MNNCYLCRVHGMNCSGRDLLLIVWAKNDDDAMEKIRLKYGQNYVGQCTLIREPVIH